MPGVRRRTTTTRSASSRPVSRRRDRVEEEDDVEEEEDEEPRPARRSTTRTRVVERHNYDDDEDEAEDEDEEERRPARRKVTAATRRKPAEVDEDEDEEEEPPARRRASKRPADDEEDDEEPVSRRRAAPAARRKTTSTRTRKTASDSTVKSGWEGAEEVRKSSGGDVNVLKLTEEPVLVKCLEDAPFATYRQHWVPVSGSKTDRPFTCLGRDCPLCKHVADSPQKNFCFNVLDLSDEAGPTNKMLRITVKPFEAFKKAATDKTTDEVVIDRNFWSIYRSGKGNQVQTNFRPVKKRDLEEDWPEIFENFDIADLDTIIEEAKESLFDKRIIQKSTLKQLEEVARFMTDSED